MGIHARFVLWILVAALGQTLPAVADPVAAGERLYRDGVGVDGKPVTAMVQGDVPVSGTQLACTGCHKRSGLGASEGGKRALMVTAAALFSPQAAQPGSVVKRRLPYSDTTLARAIETGVAVDGRALDSLMPRYRLSRADMSAITAYLRTLGTQAVPGVSTDELELVTIVAASAPAHEREAVTAVLQRFAELKNGGTRNEQRRADAARRHPYGERHARGFRHWNLSVWALNGPPSDWRRQLEALYAAHPPFAVISGAVGDDWAVVHDFCERRELPCVLPLTRLAPERPANFFNVYYSSGVRLEAQVTARSILQGEDPTGARVLVVHPDDAAGRAAAEALRQALPLAAQANLVVHALAAGANQSLQDWQKILASARPSTLVAWVSASQLQGLLQADAATLPGRIYTASSFTDWQSLRAAPALESRVLHTYPYTLGAAGGYQFPREDVWLKSQGLSGLDPRAAAGALFACHATGEALAGLADNYSREYLIETLEHMLDGTNMTSLYPVTTLGTSQRYLVKGAYVVRLSPEYGAARFQQAGWIQP